MSEPMAHKGWTEESLRRVLPHTSSGVKSILVYVATHPRCTTRDMARDLHLKSERSVGPTLNNLSRTSIELGVFLQEGPAGPSSTARRPTATSGTTCPHGSVTWCWTSSARRSPLE